MAEAKPEDPASMMLKMYDENDEFEIFAVELMTNLMKHFNDANYVVMPKLPRPSKHYSVTILKSVALVWRFTHENHCKRFRMASPIFSDRHSLFGYAIYQATTLFDRMLSYAQLVFLAAYCYELCCFLTRNGLEEYIYVSYTLFTTIWKDRYEKKFKQVGGWEYLEEALDPFAIVYDAAEAIFLPGYPLREEDLQKALKEYEDLAKQRRDRGEEPLRQDDEDQVEELDEETRRRRVTRKDWKLIYFYYVRTSEMMRVDDELEVAFKEKIIDYLKYKEVNKRMLIRRTALLDPDSVCETAAIFGSPDKATRELLPDDDSVESCRLSLDSCSIREDGAVSVGEEAFIENVEVEEGPTATTGAKPKRKKSGAKGGKSLRKKSPATCDAKDNVVSVTSSKDVEIEEGPAAATGAKPKRKKSGAKKRKSPQKECSTIPATSDAKDNVVSVSEDTSSKDVEIEKEPTPATSAKPKRKKSGAKGGKSPQKECSAIPATSDAKDVVSVSEDTSSKDVEIEKEPTAATGATPKKKKSGAEGGISPEKKPPIISAASRTTKSKKDTQREPSDQAEKMQESESSKFQCKQPTGDKPASKSAKDKGKQ